MKQISNQVTEKWNVLTKKQKIAIGAGILAVILAIASIYWFTRPKYKVLFSEPMESASIARVAEVLTERGIKYNLVHESTNVEVPDSSYQEALMYVAASDVTEKGMSIETVLNNDMSTTQTEMNLKNKEYLRQSLQDTLKKMEGIEDARIELVIPEQKNAYLQSQVKSHASVFLTLSAPLTSSQCESIAIYVASGVQNLDKENVVIIDSTGRTLFSESKDSSTALGKQQELKNAAEAEMKQKVTELLENMYDDVRISPNLVLDFDTYQEKKEQYATQGDDESRGVISHEITNSSSATNTNTGEIPGVDANGGDTPTYQTNTGGTSESKDSGKDITYAPDKTESVYTKNTGDIDVERSSLAVNLFRNRIYREETTDLEGTTWEAFKEENSTQVPLQVDATLIDSIRNATGLENVTVNAYENPIFLDQEVYTVDYRDYIPYILLVAALMIILFVVLRFRKHDEEVEVEPQLEVEEMIDTAKEQVKEEIEHLEEIEFKEGLETKQHINKFVDEKPEAVANLLRNWLSDDEWE